MARPPRNIPVKPDVYRQAGAERPDPIPKMRYLRGVTNDWFESSNENRFERITTHRHVPQEKSFPTCMPQGSHIGRRKTTGTKLDTSGESEYRAYESEGKAE